VRANGDAGLAQDGQLASLSERLLETLSLLIQRLQRCQLVRQDPRLFGSLAVSLEDEAAELPQCHFAACSQIRHSAPQHRSLQKARCADTVRVRR